SGTDPEVNSALANSEEPAISPELLRRHAEHAAEPPVKCRQIAKALFKGNVRNGCRARGEPHGGFTQSRSQEILVGSHPDDPAKGPQKMVFAHASMRRQAVEVQ